MHQPWRIRYGNISAIQILTHGEDTYQVIFHRPGLVVALCNRNHQIDTWRTVPYEVRERVMQRFEKIFQIPIEERHAQIDAMPEEEIQVCTVH